MGKLIVTNSYKNAAGIGSARTSDGGEMTVGEVVIHGGHITATGGEKAAGIGFCFKNLEKARSQQNAGSLLFKALQDGLEPTTP